MASGKYRLCLRLSLPAVLLESWSAKRVPLCGGGCHPTPGKNELTPTASRNQSRNAGGAELCSKSRQTAEITRDRGSRSSPHGACRSHLGASHASVTRHTASTRAC